MLSNILFHMGNNIQLKYPLFANPSAFEGIGRILDLGGTLQQYNYSNNPKAADYKELLHDWYTIGNDIRSSINEYEKSLTVK